MVTGILLYSGLALMGWSVSHLGTHQQQACKSNIPDDVEHRHCGLPCSLLHKDRKRNEHKGVRRGQVCSHCIQGDSFSQQLPVRTLLGGRGNSQ